MTGITPHIEVRYRHIDDEIYHYGALIAIDDDNMCLVALFVEGYFDMVELSRLEIV